MKLNSQGIKDNAQNVIGVIVGLVVCKPLNLRFNKSERGMFKLFSTVAANSAADGIIVLLPYKMIC